MCCDKPCLIPTWVASIYGYLCTNCTAFRPC